MTYEETDYFRRREMQERAAAKDAASLAARRVHQQMAENYDAILNDYVFRDALTSLRACGAL